MIHISSDYVFDGNSNESYTPECNILSIIYLKLIGEQWHRPQSMHDN